MNSEVVNMRIQGPNPYLNLYNQQKYEKVNNNKKETKDQLAISSEAKLMQMQKSQKAERKQHVQEIKERVQADEYKVDHQKTAEKLMKYWNIEK